MSHSVSLNMENKVSIESCDEDLKEALLTHVNNKIEDKKASVERHLQAMCQPNSFPKGRPPMPGPSLAVTLKPPHA